MELATGQAQKAESNFNGAAKTLVDSNLPANASSFVNASGMQQYGYPNFPYPTDMPLMPMMGGFTGGFLDPTTYGYNVTNMTAKGLVFTYEQDGYYYYEDPVEHRQYSLDAAGFWYVWDESKNAYVSVDEADVGREVAATTAGVTTTTGNTTTMTASGDSATAVAGAGTKDAAAAVGATMVESGETTKAFATPAPSATEPTTPHTTPANASKPKVFGIDFDADDGFPIFPTNAKNQPILPRDANDQPFFPVDEREQPIFPYDRVNKKWTFPVDDTEEPVFPRNAFNNKPIVPVDENNSPIFPLDERGEFIFPFDENHCPTPALTPDGRVVIPTDEFGQRVIPRDREGRPLIYMAEDGVTPLSLAEYRQWKQSKRPATRKAAVMNDFRVQHGQQPIVGVVGATAPTTCTAQAIASPLVAPSIFHPLNLEQYTSSYKNDDIAVLQRTKRVRPEDIDLPIFAASTMPDSSHPIGQFAVGNSAAASGDANSQSAQNTPTAAAADNGDAEEEERARKRKRMLSAQLHFSKRLPPKGIAQKPKNASGTATTVVVDSAPNMGGGEPQTIQTSTNQTPTSETPTTEAAHGRRQTPAASRRENNEKSEKSSDRRYYDDSDSANTYDDDYDDYECDYEDANGSRAPSRKSASKSHRRQSSRTPDFDELDEHSDLDVVKRVIKRHRRRYDDFKKKIAELEKKKNRERMILKKLYDVEYRVEERLGI